MERARSNNVFFRVKEKVVEKQTPKIPNIFTAKIFRIILNGKTLLYSGLF